ncbi:hypothetical protein PHLGIDRAFT_173143 [Phlebiopsis gigantea 11061_1 CR5-6]|uniref:Uncharacterized protein n=1 Tax=Phlebiopsis gigantea (strain 11061_1 CR5-6) TaxID=745531 RepID=A0A0C3PTV1_PHLG1|nr:hypothetical protein PHLGIDRAFT_173143 [Phlebiopsis gigantea 11061_1 CR5-6]
MSRTSSPPASTTCAGRRAQVFAAGLAQLHPSASSHSQAPRTVSAAAGPVADEPSRVPSQAAPARPTETCLTHRKLPAGRQLPAPWQDARLPRSHTERTRRVYRMSCDGCAIRP